MKPGDLLKQLFIFIVFVGLHVLWVRNFVFYDVAFCFLYLAFVINLPLSIPIPALLFTGFCTGLMVDLFYDTTGEQAAACLAILFLRPNIIMLLTPLGGYDENMDLSIGTMGIRWYAVYVLIMVFIHSFIFFLLEAGGFSYFYWTLLKVFASTLFTSFMIITLQYLLFTQAGKGKR